MTRSRFRKGKKVLQGKENKKQNKAKIIKKKEKERLRKKQKKKKKKKPFPGSNLGQPVCQANSKPLCNVGMHD